ncbi:MAG: T9SS type A sorting domain-containing protein, partial [Chitinophagaceae bacterium]
VAMNKRYVTGGGLYHTTDGGVNWEKSNADEIFDENSYPNFVHFKDKNHGVAQGDPNGGYFEVYTTDNKGKKWKRVPQKNLPAPLPNEYGWLSGFYAVDKTIWFGTSAGRMYKSTNFGKDWTAYVVAPASKFVMEIAFNDDKLHGVTHVRDNFGTYLYQTSDGGVTWTNLGSPANWKSSRITAVPGTNALISTGINGNPAFRGSAISYDNGTTWTELERSVQRTVSRFYDAETGYACAAFITGPPLRGGIWKSAIVFELPANNKKGPHEEKTVSVKQPSVEVKSDDLVKVYPTPARDVISILLQDPLAITNKTISIISMDGRVMLSTQQGGSNLVRLNVSKLPAGVYTVRITTNAQTINKVITIVR